MKNVILTGLLFVVYANCLAQDKKSRWRAGFNPLSLAESQLSLGPAVAYRFNGRVEFWAETSYIFANSYMPRQWKNMTGFRFIFQPRYYLGQSKSFFMTPEFRMKTYSFDNALDFINATTADTLHAFPFRERQLLLGGAVVIGKQYSFLKNKQLQLEISAGLGGKHRFIRRKKIPEGYQFMNRKGGFGLRPAYEDDNTGTILFPLGFRLMWQIK